MPLLSGRPARDLREEDLLTLIGTASEGRVIDFKRDPIGTSDDAKREFLADVSSFANTVGGHVVIGMDEDEGIASNLLGIDVPDVDAETLRLENILRDGLDPLAVRINRADSAGLRAGQSGRRYRTQLACAAYG